MDGLIFIIPTVLVMVMICLFGKIKFNTTILIVIFTFFSYSIIGFIDYDYYGEDHNILYIY